MYKRQAQPQPQAQQPERLSHFPKQNFPWENRDAEQSPDTEHSRDAEQRGGRHAHPQGENREDLDRTIQLKPIDPEDTAHRHRNANDNTNDNED